MRKSLLIFIALAIPLVLSHTFVFGQTESRTDRGAQIMKMVKHDVSIPLRDMPPAGRPSGVKLIHPNPVLPLSDRDKVVHIDAVEQTAAFPSSSAPTSAGDFEGIGEGLGNYNAIYVPPDTNGDIGPSHYVQTVNADLAIFSKNGSVVYGPVAIKTLWSGFGGDCQNYNDGDPTVVYDQFADRWIIAQFTASATPYYECVAVSTSGDPTGTYHRYAYSFGNTFPDYPKMAVWPSANAYFITFNMFGSSFLGANVCAFQRDKLLSGQANSMQCKMTSSSYGGLLAADQDGATAIPAGVDEYVLGRSGTTLAAWRFHVDWSNSANTSMTGPLSVGNVASFSLAVCKGGSSLSCVPQPGRVKLDTLGDRLMNRLAYRRLSDHDALVASHTVSGSGGIIAVRWYELRPSGNSVNVFQQGTFSPDSNHRWMPSIGMDKFGNIAVGYSVSSSSVYPGIRYTGRVPTDPNGTMQVESTVVNGSGSQSQYSRWGDYASIQTDPTDDCTFWFTTEYMAVDGSFNWHTRIASFQFPGCGGGGTGDTTPPTTSITSPSNGSTVSGTVSVTASASDNVGVTKVEFYIDGALRGTDTSAPYQYSWNTTSETNAGHSIVSKAYDAANNVGTSSTVNVTVDNPTSGINLSASGYKVKGVQNVDLSWSGASSVDIYRDGGWIATVNGNSYTDNLNTKGGGVSYDYQVCAAGTGNCSNVATVVF